jgi:hypothetical protein
MAIFLHDTFTGTDGTALSDHVGEVGATWTDDGLNFGGGGGGTWELHGNRARFLDGGSGAHDGGYDASGAPASAEYIVSFQVRCNASIAAFEGCGVTARHVGSTYYFAGYSQKGGYSGLSGDAWIILKNGALLASFVQALTVGQTYAVEFHVTDARKYMSIDGVERLSITDNAIASAGKVGVHGGAAGNLSIDEITGTDIVPFVPSPIPRLILSQGNL